MECRICYEDDSKEPLIVPCSCSGSMKYIHTSCLQKWFMHTQNTMCNVCKQPFEVKRTKTQDTIKFLLESKYVTTFFTFVIGCVLLRLSMYFDIKPNTISIVIFMSIAGMNAIQYYFGHEEINFNELSLKCWFSTIHIMVEHMGTLARFVHVCGFL